MPDSYRAGSASFVAPSLTHRIGLDILEKIDTYERVVFSQTLKMKSVSVIEQAVRFCHSLNYLTSGARRINYSIFYCKDRIIWILK